MRVLFVSGIDGFCHRYQVLHRAAQLAALGAATTVRPFADPRLIADLATHDVLFLYRVPMTTAVHELLGRAAARAVPRIAAIDDLIFVDDAGSLPSLDALPEAARAQWRAGVRRYAATIAACDAFVAPTEPLVEVGAGLGWRSYLHRNALSPAELELGRRAQRAAEAGARPDPVLGYFSGTPTHDEDFASIATALADVLRRHPRARLLVLGPLAIGDVLAPFAGRVDRRPLVGWHDLPAAIASVDVCLAPLCTAQPFARAKGEIKYLEAAAVGVPTVASATSAYRHAIRDGANGRLATTADEWRGALDELLRDAGLRRRLGAAAQADVAVRYGEAARGGELLAVLEDVRTAPRRRPQTLNLTSKDVFDVEPPARVALEPDACPAFPAGLPRLVSPPLVAGRRIEQRLRVAHNGLLRVDLHTVTYGQALDQQLRLALRRADGVQVGQALLPAADAPDRAWLALELDAAEHASGGRTYTLEVSVPSASGPAAICFGLTADDAADGEAGCGALGPALLDGVPLGGALALRGFAAWGDALPEGAAGAAPGETADGVPAPGAGRGASRRELDAPGRRGAETWQA